MKKMMKKMATAAFLLKSNPLVFSKTLNAKVKSLWPLPKYPVQRKINGVWFEFDFGYDQAMSHMYWGSYEIAVIELMHKFLKRGDAFIDAGANIGYLSAIAMGLVGETGSVHSFEPIPEYFHRLKSLAAANKGYRLIANQCALGEKEGKAKMHVVDTAHLPDIGLSTLVRGLVNGAATKKAIEVSTRRLDRYIEEKLDTISLIKIDTEGYEFPVLKGLENYLEKSAHRPPIICEITPRAYPLLGYDLRQLSEYMNKYAYCAFSVLNTKTKVDICQLTDMTNVLFLPM